MTVATKKISRVIAVLAFSLLAFAGSISAANAHDQLIGSTPKDGATVKQARKTSPWNSPVCSRAYPAWTPRWSR